jgi:hypothetical protein
MARALKNAPVTEQQRSHLAKHIENLAKTQNYSHEFRQNRKLYLKLCEKDLFDQP